MTAITVLCDRKSKTMRGFEIKGHAGWADSGRDIVCAAVSILAINTQNAIERFCKDRFEQTYDEKKGFMKFLIDGLPGHDTELLLEAARMGFEGIAAEYDEFVTIKTKEV